MSSSETSGVHRSGTVVSRQGVTDLFDMSDRVVIVTGGTRGIGWALAQGYGAAGAKVVVASRKADACAEAERELCAQGVDAIGVAVHMGDLDDANRLVERTVAAFGQVDVVVNNAATALAEPVGAYTPEAWQKVMDVNLRGPVFLVQAALPYLKQSENAAVLNIISGSAFLFATGMSMYATTKGGLLAHTRTAAAELAPLNIRVNAIAPGAIETDMILANSTKAQEEFANSMLMKRLGQPHEVVGAALLLSSSAGSFITGQTLCVDGGTVPH